MRSNLPDLPRDLAERIEQARPRLGRLGATIHFLPIVGSTNDFAAALARSGECEGAVVLADAQTAGRGRRGHGWHSPPGSGLYVSVVLAPARAKTDPARATILLTLAVGVALAEAIDTATGLVVHVKWPNDLYVGRRKVAGILAEAVNGASACASGGSPESYARVGSHVGERSAPVRRPVLDTREHDGASASASGGGAPREEEMVIVGYGINVGPMAFPPALGDRATSLELEAGRPIEPDPLLVETLAAVARRYDDLLEGRFDAILDAWRRLAPGSVGSRVAWPTPAGVQHGVTAGVDEHGALLVRVGDRVERIVAGELTWL